MQLKGANGHELFQDFLKRAGELPEADLSKLKHTGYSLRRPGGKDGTFDEIRANLEQAQRVIIARRADILNLLKQSPQIDGDNFVKWEEEGLRIQRTQIRLSNRELGRGFFEAKETEQHEQILDVLFGGKEIAWFFQGKFSTTRDTLTLAGRQAASEEQVEEFRMQWDFNTGKARYLVGGNTASKKGTQGIQWEGEKWIMGPAAYSSSNLAPSQITIREPYFSGTQE